MIGNDATRRAVPESRIYAMFNALPYRISGRGNSKEAKMRKLAVALGVLAVIAFAGSMAWKANAAAWRSGTLTLPSVTKNYSPIEPAACGRLG
jgi:hypothetical protein